MEWRLCGGRFQHRHARIGDEISRNTRPYSQRHTSHAKFLMHIFARCVTLHAPEVGETPTPPTWGRHARPLQEPGRATHPPQARPGSATPKQVPSAPPVAPLIRTQMHAGTVLVPALSDAGVFTFVRILDSRRRCTPTGGNPLPHPHRCAPRLRHLPALQMAGDVAPDAVVAAGSAASKRSVTCADR